MNITIEGNGVFGTFLRKELSAHVNIDDDSSVVILAVPASAYEAMALKHQNKHLINVCSIQEDTTSTCLETSSLVTSIHPMFGPRSPADGRSCIVTRAITNSSSKMANKEVQMVLDLFAKICTTMVYEVNGVKITPRMHDEMMAKTHMKVVEISDHILQLVANAKDIPEECLPTSFKRLKAMAEQFLDMPLGTKESILSNKY
jgi:prephenate dehydrogenase